jgi:hypothetical protein
MITGVMRRVLPGAAWLTIAVLADLGVAGLAPAGERPAADEALYRLQISSEEARRLGRGEIVSYPVTERSERELAVGLAVFVAAPVSHLEEYLASGQLIAQDVTISDFGIVPDPAGPDALSRRHRELGSTCHCPRSKLSAAFATHPTGRQEPRRPRWPGAHIAAF